MTQITRVSIPMSVEEREALKAIASIELRDPREQARYMLRQALGLTSEDDARPQPINNCVEQVLADADAVAA